MTASSIPLVALDIHKRFSMAVILDENGAKLGEAKIPHDDGGALSDFFERFPKGTEVVMEATFNWHWIADCAEGSGLQPVLAHPPMVRQMAKNAPKSDRRDATFLGKLRLSSTLFPGVWIPPQEVREMREVFRLREVFVADRSGLKNAVHSQLLKMGICTEEAPTDLFSVSGRKIIAGLKLRPLQKLLIEQKLKAIDDLTERIEALNEVIEAEVKEDPQAEILMTIPGIGKISAYAILAEIGTVERFPNARALASYAGVLPRNRESGGKDMGKTTGGACNKHLRWIAIECACGAVKGSPAMRALRDRVKSRNGKAGGKARVAVARRIMELVWTLLTSGEKYTEPKEK
jgi:transposase